MKLEILLLISVVSVVSSFDWGWWPSGCDKICPPCPVGEVPVLDSNKCPTCKCRPKPEIACPLLQCDNPCSGIRVIGTDGCHTCKCKKCYEPKNLGICGRPMPRYFYDVISRSCKEFIFGGCIPSGNTFKTKARCQAVCEI